MTADALEPLDPALYREIVRRALAEDLGWGDVTTDATIPSDLKGRGTLLAKASFVLAGLDVAFEAFRQLDPSATITEHRRDGDTCQPGEIIAEIRGYAGPLLTAERTALNFLQRMSGIASVTRRYVDATGGKVTLLDTRKTTPTLRVLERHAVRVGGGTNHRMGLDDGILIKDNHVKLAGGVAEAVRRMRAAGLEMPIEVEAQSLADVDAALEAGAPMILLDNMAVDEMREAVRRSRGRAKIEISGGVTLERLPDLASVGADYVSSGALTHSAKSVDISFEVEPI